MKVGSRDATIDGKERVDDEVFAEHRHSLTEQVRSSSPAVDVPIPVSEHGQSWVTAARETKWMTGGAPRICDARTQHYDVSYPVRRQGTSAPARPLQRIIVSKRRTMDSDGTASVASISRGSTLLFDVGG